MILAAKSFEKFTMLIPRMQKFFLVVLDTDVIMYMHKNDTRCALRF